MYVSVSTVQLDRTMRKRPWQRPPGAVTAAYDAAASIAVQTRAARSVGRSTSPNYQRRGGGGGKGEATS